jgi:ferritin-like metal-binding protein YciE
MQDLFLEEIEDLYDCEKRLTKALPKMAKAANSPELRQAVDILGHVERLERVFSALRKKPKAETCQAIQG